MRMRLLTGLLVACSAVVVHSQTLSISADDTGKRWDWSLPQKDVLNPPANSWRLDFGLPLSLPGKAQPTDKGLWANGLSRDEKFILHPPKAWAGTISPGVPSMQNRYPGLKIQPLCEPQNKTEARLDAIPAKWPDLKIESIPLAWPKVKISGVQEP